MNKHTVLQRIVTKVDKFETDTSYMRVSSAKTDEI